MRKAATGAPARAAWTAAALALVLAGSWPAAGPTSAEPADLAASTGGSAEPPPERVHQQAPVLGISKSVSPNPMIAGDEATYTVTVTNSGDEAAEDVTVTDTLDGDLDFASSPDCTASGQVVTCGGDGTTIAPGGSATYQITVRVDPGVSDGTNITNPAEAAASNAQGARTQNIAQTQTLTDVEITKTGDPATVNPDGTITYTIVVTNNGPSDAVEVFVQDPTNGNLTTIESLPGRCPPSGLAISCDLGTLAPGDAVELEVTVSVNPGVAPGTEIVNCATVYTGSRESDTGNNDSCATTVVGPIGDAEADLAVAETGPATVQPDGTITYAVSVTNNGPDTAESAVLEDALDIDHTAVETLPQQCAAVGSSVRCSLGDLEAGETVELTVVLRVDADDEPGTLINNCAEAHTPTAESTTGNNAACVQTEIEGGTPSPSPSPLPSPTDGPSPSPSPTDDPAPTPGPTDSPAPGPTDEPTEGPDGYGYDGAGPGGAALPVTGAGAAALCAAGLLAAASGLVLRLTGGCRLRTSV
ncbi:COG1361 S-layer family protein [Streptomonospora wellingtoniae]|uniref:CARDB domain-containing protein n=1 Tax=Streptomonospora wellingtoniae TaxID=3075544 RepID=A0ABU2KV86_9ACTN|nr:CARDB domain-containing protein [Streptomonospora sp. DSM 45055]MDT0303211.1 CARDB domain-containing protein [Streptomonospora sp. DSM 45055]